MKQVQVLTPWTGEGTAESPYHPQIADQHGIHSYRDVTAQVGGVLIPDPNLFVAEIVCEDGILTNIEADQTYHVLWSQNINA